jgi:hypothetical protein
VQLAGPPADLSGARASGDDLLPAARGKSTMFVVGVLLTSALVVAAVLYGVTR